MTGNCDFFLSYPCQANLSFKHIQQEHRAEGQVHRASSGRRTASVGFPPITACGLPQAAFRLYVGQAAV